MNLSGDPWIPVALPDGRADLVGLEDAFRHGREIRDLLVEPPQRVALMRLLICITQAALDGPEDEEDWCGCADRIVPASLAYLERYRDKFELFGRGAFLQPDNLERTDNALLDKLDFGLAAGNNPVLFDHAAAAEGRPQRPAWMALMMLTYQCFSPGGLIGSSNWDGAPTGRSSEHAPCVEGSALHLLLRGSDLQQTVHLNLVTKEQVLTLPEPSWGRPVWEAFPRSPTDTSARELASSYLGRLVPLSRAIKLQSESRQLTLANGLTYGKLPAVRDPSLTVIVRKQGAKEALVYLGIDLEKHPWRELGSVLTLKAGELTGGPLALQHVRNSDVRTIDIWTGGLATNRAKILDSAEWTFALPIDLVGDTALNQYRKGVELADRGARSLFAAGSAYCDDMKISNAGGSRQKSNWIRRTQADYWRRLNQQYGELVRIACDEEADLQPWRRTLLSCMHQAYSITCPHETPRQLKAFALGRSRLRLAKDTDK